MSSDFNRTKHVKKYLHSKERGIEKRISEVSSFLIDRQSLLMKCIGKHKTAPHFEQCGLTENTSSYFIHQARFQVGLNFTQPYISLVIVFRKENRGECLPTLISMSHSRVGNFSVYTYFLIH